MAGRGVVRHDPQARTKRSAPIEKPILAFRQTIIQQPIRFCRSPISTPRGTIHEAQSNMERPNARRAFDLKAGGNPPWKVRACTTQPAVSRAGTSQREGRWQGVLSPGGCRRLVGLTIESFTRSPRLGTEKPRVEGEASRNSLCRGRIS